MPEWLTRKVGPLPVWGYGVLGLGVVLFLRARAKQAGTTTTPGVSTNYSSTVPDVPTESITTPSGFSYQGPAGGGQYYIPQGAMSATAGSPGGGGVTTPTPPPPPPAASTPPPPPSSAPSLPPVNAANFPQIVKFGQYSPSDYTQIGTVSNGTYTGQQVSGGVPVYTNLFGGFAQGPFPQQGTYGVYIPSQFTQYEHA